MYVRFAPGIVPTTDTMYWRALVLWNYRNGTWTQGDLDLTPKSPAATDSGQIRQEITIRPHNQKWLFALDVPVTVPVNKAELSTSWATLLKGDIVQLEAGKLDHTERYDVVSSPTPPEEDLQNDEAKSAINLPDGEIDPAVRDLADHLHQGLSEDQELEYVYAVLKYFHHGGFVYSATPGIQGPNWLPVFLFKTKTGFCEHFASAFAILMRVKHIPARLVVGYQGAEYNPYSDYYTIAQSNAHAWDEVWLKAKRKWIRVDPTAILPMTEEGLPANVAEGPGDPLSIQIAHHRTTLFEDYLPAWATGALKEMKLRREQVETNWDNLVFSYDPEAQSRLTQALGFGGQARVELLLVCLGGGLVCFVVFKRWMARRPSLSPVEILYTAFCRNMARRGIPRAAWEGPLAYTERVAEAFPDDKLAIHRVGSIVAQARYGSTSADSAASHDLKALLTLITASQAAASSRDRR